MSANSLLTLVGVLSPRAREPLCGANEINCGVTLSTGFSLNIL